jgi:hypothetical protein
MMVFLSFWEDCNGTYPNKSRKVGRTRKWPLVEKNMTLKRKTKKKSSQGHCSQRGDSGSGDAVTAPGSLLRGLHLVAARVALDSDTSGHEESGGEDLPSGIVVDLWSGQRDLVAHGHFNGAAW